jgi:hypothetical protein
MAPKPGRRLDPAPGDPRADPTPPEPGSVGRAVIRLVSVDLVGSPAPPPRRRADRRNVLQDGREHGGVGHVGGGDHRSQRQPTTVADQVELGPRLATIDRICANVVPRVSRARLWCPRWPATSPAGPARPAGPRPQGGARRTPQPRRTRSAAASRSLGSRSQARGRAAAAKGWRCGPCTRSQRSSCDPRWCGADRRTGPGRGRQQGLHQCPQLVGHEVINEDGHGAESCHTRTKERNDL